MDICIGSNVREAGRSSAGIFSAWDLEEISFVRCCEERLIPFDGGIIIFVAVLVLSRPPWRLAAGERAVGVGVGRPWWKRCHG